MWFRASCFIVVSKSNKMQQLRFYSSQWLTLHVSGDNLTHHQEYICCIFNRKHDTEQQDSDYLQLHNDRTTLLLTNLQPKWASLPVAIYSLCTPDDGWDRHPKHVELAIAKNKNAIVASCWTYFTTIRKTLFLLALWSWSSYLWIHRAIRLLLTTQLQVRSWEASQLIKKYFVFYRTRKFSLCSPEPATTCTSCAVSAVCSSHSHLISPK